MLSPPTSFLVPAKFFYLFLVCLMFRAAVVTSQQAIIMSKRLYIVRHGQAMHNPRAEVAKANGCSMDEFFALMREDDVLDAPLTEEGKKQATKSATTVTTFLTSLKEQQQQKDIELVIASSLTRAMQTADLVYPTLSSASASSAAACPRISLEQFREVNGDLLNAKRRTRQELQTDFASWNFEQLEGDDDSLWTKEMETFESAAERGYQGLCWVLNRPEEAVLLVSHGGILRYMMNIHPLIQLRDARTKPSAASSEELKAVEARFDNCEVRGYDIQWSNGKDEDTCQESKTEGTRRSIVLTQVDL